MIITLSGTPGSGKSTIAKQLLEKLHAQRVYVGGIRRELARQKGMTLEQLNEYAKTNPETDKDVDEAAAQEARELAKTSPCVIVEGRTQFHFLPESFKIFLKVDLSEAAKRIWLELQEKQAQVQRNEGTFTSLEQLKQSIIKRDEQDAQRYLKYYDFDHRDESQYDYILDTTHLTIEQVVQTVFEKIQSINSNVGSC